MNFFDLKANYPVYFIIMQGSEMKGETGKVINVSDPRFKQPQPNNMPSMPFPMTTNTQREIDVTIQTSFGTKSYTVSENSVLSTAKVDDMFIKLTPDKETALRELEAIRSQSNEELSRTEKNKNIVAACDSISEMWNPDLAEKKGFEKRLGTLETNVDKIMSVLSSLDSKMDKIGAK